MHLYNASVLTMKYAHLALNNWLFMMPISSQPASSGTITWLVGLGIRERGKLAIHMAMGLAIWAPVFSLGWYICWSLDNCQMEALNLLYASYALPLLLHLL